MTNIRLVVLYICSHYIFYVPNLSKLSNHSVRERVKYFRLSLYTNVVARSVSIRYKISVPSYIRAYNYAIKLDLASSRSIKIVKSHCIYFHCTNSFSVINYNKLLGNISVIAGAYNKFVLSFFIYIDNIILQNVIFNVIILTFN